MSDSIISRQAIQQRGAAAFTAGKSRDSHNMNPWAPAVTEFQQGYDRAADEFYHGTANGARVDVAQQVAA